MRFFKEKERRRREFKGKKLILFNKRKRLQFDD